MPRGFGLFPQGYVRLAILVRFRPEFARIVTPFASLNVEVIRLRAALVDEIFRKIEVARFAGRLIQPDQSKLYLGMAAIAAPLPLLWTELLINVINITAEHIQQFSFARRLIIGNCTFHQMSGVVEFVPVT